MRKEEKNLLMQQLQTGNDIGIAPYFASRTFSITTDLALLPLQREMGGEGVALADCHQLQHLLS